MATMITFQTILPVLRGSCPSWAARAGGLEPAENRLTSVELSKKGTPGWARPSISAASSASTTSVMKGMSKPRASSRGTHCKWLNSSSAREKSSGSFRRSSARASRKRASNRRGRPGGVMARKRTQRGARGQVPGGEIAAPARRRLERRRARGSGAPSRRPVSSQSSRVAAAMTASGGVSVSAARRVAQSGRWGWPAGSWRPPHRPRRRERRISRA
jgi:hypothetical protein